jgi:hypothetical protein
MPVLVVLTCAIAEASPLSWHWDIFQPANSLGSASVYSAATDAINSLANSYLTGVGDIANWLPPAVALSDLYSNSGDGDEAATSLDGELLREGETVPGGLTQFDLSLLCDPPRVVDRQSVSTSRAGVKS